MTWRDRLLPGSFRGVPFSVTESSTTFGRRNKLHEYPGRDVPWSEDLGRKAGAWSIECITIGDDYDTARNALIAACNATGPGTLVHPYLGTLSATCGEATVTDSTAEGGLARFTIPFTESGVDVTPAPTPDTQGQAIASAATLQSQSVVSATNDIQVGDQAAFVTTEASSVLGQAQAALTTALRAVQAPAALLASVEPQIAAIETTAVALLNAPANLVSQIYGAIAGIASIAPYADDALAQCEALLGFGANLPAVAPITPDRIAQGGNQVAIVQLVQCAAAASAVTVVSQIDFTSYDDAVGIRDPLSDSLDALALAIADGGDDDLADAVDQMRLAMIADVTARGGSLARLYAYTPATTEPALVIAQRLYGDATRADEIVARNAIAHPGFVPGGLVLEVLSDD